jgi:hypothetical protein
MQNWKHSSQMASGSSWTKQQMCNEARGLHWKMIVYMFLCTFHRVRKQ